MQITVQDPPAVVINRGPFTITRPYYNSSLVAVKVTKPCVHCGKPVTFTRGGVFSGNSFHESCNPDDGAFQASVLGAQTPAEYQNRHGVAWNE